MINYGSGISVPWLQRKEDRATAVIMDWLEKCDARERTAEGNRFCYCSVSGGKDSLVAADLITRVFPTCPLVWVNQGPLAEWPDCVELLELWKQQGRNVIELCPVRSLWNLYKDYGIPLEGKMTSKLDKLINQRLMYDPLQEYQELHGIKGYAWGLRQESSGRAKLLQSKGELYHLKSGLWVCSPVGFWRTEEIWQYVDKYSTLR